MSCTLKLLQEDSIHETCVLPHLKVQKTWVIPCPPAALAISLGALLHAVHLHFTLNHQDLSHANYPGLVHAIHSGFFSGEYTISTLRTHSVSGFKDFLFGYHILQLATAVPSPVSIATSIGYTSGSCNKSYNKELYSVPGTDSHNQLFLNTWSPAGIQLDTHFILMFDSPRTRTSSTTCWYSQVDHKSPHTESSESITQTSQSSQSSPLANNVDSYTPGKDNHN